ncbi:MAG: MgtC/SapB family protein [Niameybacter sp.]|uniref:MgtC/SapB family protein n=1 Tax=Niameybacter sp. TaxID=2033640 RepID=UPI002FCBAEAB
MGTFEYLKELNILSTIVRLSLATLFGGIIGFERGRKRRPAGLRTHILVCIGATLAMLTNQYVVQILGVGQDATRLGAQVISGIGFLGAGTILVTGKQQVKGLTTAAGLWACACMGLAIGIGFYEGAVIGCLFILGGVSVLHKLDMYLVSRAKEVEFYIEIAHIQDLGDILTRLKVDKIQVVALEITKCRIEGMEKIGMFITLKLCKHYTHLSLIETFASMPQVEYIEEI